MLRLGLSFISTAPGIMGYRIDLKRHISNRITDMKKLAGLFVFLIAAWVQAASFVVEIHDWSVIGTTKPHASSTYDRWELNERWKISGYAPNWKITEVFLPGVFNSACGYVSGTHGWSRDWTSASATTCVLKEWCNSNVIWSQSPSTPTCASWFNAVQGYYASYTDVVGSNGYQHTRNAFTKARLRLVTGNQSTNYTVTLHATAQYLDVWPGSDGFDPGGPSGYSIPYSNIKVGGQSVNSQTGFINVPISYSQNNKDVTVTVTDANYTKHFRYQLTITGWTPP